MGVDLFLLPFEPSGEGTYAYTVLEVERRRLLWESIKAIPSYPVPDRFMTLVSIAQTEERDWVHGNTQQDSYEQPIRWVYAKDLKRLHGHEAVEDNHRNQAVWAYLNALPDDMPVALVWW